MTGKRTRLSAASGLALIALALSGPAEATDRHSNYYYPPHGMVEIYKARAEVFPGASAVRRIGFVTAITLERLKKPYPPTAVFFAKGDSAEKLIIVALEDGRLDTIYRVRAFLASLTAVARTTPAFQNAPVADNLTFFDLARMLGFEMITVSDGATFTHQVRFE